MPTDAAIAELATEIRLACMRISRRVRFESGSSLAPHQFSVLVRLGEHPRTPRELADIEKVSAPSMTRTTNGLVERGLVARAADPDDGRCVILSLTPEGAAQVATIRAARDGWMSSRVGNLTPEEREVLRQASAILHKVAQA
ncbi:MarR family transcriptional regulator [Nostocoides vanveenii]|uniref:MarR family transcriptional regulator n=1 Tax=Nostocoides vanveenii TaxID=330835 RepID=A0ABN2KHW2_9MICO